LRKQFPSAFREINDNEQIAEFDHAYIDSNGSSLVFFLNNIEQFRVHQSNLHFAIDFLHGLLKRVNSPEQLFKAMGQRIDFYLRTVAVRPCVK
jgi:hypothetical protein